MVLESQMMPAILSKKAVKSPGIVYVTKALRLTNKTLIKLSMFSYRMIESDQMKMLLVVSDLHRLLQERTKRQPLPRTPKPLKVVQLELRIRQKLKKMRLSL